VTKKNEGLLFSFLFIEMRINECLFNYPRVNEVAFVRDCLDNHGERIEDVNPSSAFSRPCVDDAATLRFLIERGMRGTISDIQRTFHLGYCKAFPLAGQLGAGELLAVELILKTHNIPKTSDWVDGVSHGHVRTHINQCLQKTKQNCLNACLAFFAALRVLPRDIRRLIVRELWETRWDFGKWLW